MRPIKPAQSGISPLSPRKWLCLSCSTTSRISEALAAQRWLYPFLDALFAEEFPSAVRVTFENLGLPIGKSLPPVGELSKASLRRLERAVADPLAAGFCRGSAEAASPLASQRFGFR
jgi:dihydrodipicolinate synthase/N-acetylneuraminate lyase